MTPAERKLCAKVLRMASDQFCNHGCNDFHLVKEGGLTPEESYNIRVKMRAYNGDADEVEESPDNHYTQDWFVMAYLADLVSKET